jgi:hypothetical protein
MTLTVDLPPELEARLRAEADRQGVDATLYVLRVVRDRLGGATGDSLAPAEAELVLKVNLGLPDQVWARYHELLAKRRAETLAPAEQAELVAISDQIEEANARRMAHLVELARLRGVTLDSLMLQLGINGSNG